MTRLVEKYRPREWSEVVGQEDIVSTIRSNLARKERWGLPHYLFIGPTSGTGKTTIGMLIAKELKIDFHEFNASDERGIDFIRDEIKRLSQYKGMRIVFLDEADNLTADAQQAMRRIMEQTEETIFILTGNEEWKIIDAIKSRCSIFRFPRLSDKDVEKKIVEIIKKESIALGADTPEKQTAVREGLRRLVVKSGGDLRTAINDLEKIVNEHGQITPESVAVLEDATSLHVVALKYALDGNFTAAKAEIEKAHIEGKFDSRNTFRELYKALETIEDEEIKIRLYEKLGTVESNSKRGSDVLIQILAFIAYAWLIPHLSRCPVLRGDK